MLHVVLIMLAIILLAVGLFGAALPYLPGLPLAFLGTILLGRLTDFQFFDTRWLWFFGSLTLASLACDQLAGFLGSRWGKSSLWGTIGALIGGLIGVIFFSIWGLILGPALGVLALEFVAKRDHLRAVRVARVTLVASIIGLVINVLLAIVYAVTLALILIF